MYTAAPQHVTEVVIQSGVGVLTLTSPPMNALSAALRAALAAS